MTGTSGVAMVLLTNNQYINHGQTLVISKIMLLSCLITWVIVIENSRRKVGGVFKALSNI